MIRENCDPVGHISPLPRIEIGRLGFKPAKVESVEHSAKHLRLVEIERIWQAVVQAAKGHGA
jgi:hypothetical protein